MTPLLKQQVLDYLREAPGDLSLSEAKARSERFAALPDELFELAEQMSPPGASLAEKLDKTRSILAEVVRLAEAAPGEGPAARIAAAVTPAAGADAASTTLSFAESRPDVLLAKLAHEIRLSEGVDYGQALDRARQRDPGLAKRYREATYGGPAATSTGERPDIELAERTRTRMTSDGVGYHEAMRLELAEDPALAGAYARRFDSGGNARLPALPIPRGYRLITKRADVELAERAEARAAADRCDYGTAMSLVLAEDDALATRYHDYTARHSAIDELAYRVETIRAAARGRDHITEPKAVSLALSEDPTLKDAVFCYFERA